MPLEVALPLQLAISSGNVALAQLPLPFKATNSKLVWKDHKHDKLMSPLQQTKTQKSGQYKFLLEKGFSYYFIYEP